MQWGSVKHHKNLRRKRHGQPRQSNAFERGLPSLPRFHAKSAGHCAGGDDLVSLQGLIQRLAGQRLHQMHNSLKRVAQHVGALSCRLQLATY